jgi:hypothetical protein
MVQTIQIHSHEPGLYFRVHTLDDGVPSPDTAVLCFDSQRAGGTGAMYFLDELTDIWQELDFGQYYGAVISDVDNFVEAVAKETSGFDKQLPPWSVYMEVYKLLQQAHTQNLF